MTELRDQSVAAIKARWRDYMTPRDRWHLDHTWSKNAEFGVGTKPALLVIDVYYRSVGTSRLPLQQSVAEFETSCGLEGWAAIDRMVPVIDAARSAGVPVIYLKSLDGPGGLRRMVNPRGTPADDDPTRQGRGSDIVDEVAPQPGDVVLEKTGPSAFAGTPLAFHLISRGIDTVVCIGESTSGCVRATAISAASHRYKVVVVPECCYDRTEASHDMNLFDIHQKYADLWDADQAISYFKEPTA